jgi:hypothetical protein
MAYNEKVNLLRSTIAVVICLPAFVAFQTVSRPLMLCLQETCDMAQCEIADAGQPCEMAVQEPVVAPGCHESRMKTVSSCGGCELKERPLRVASCNPDRTQTNPCCSTTEDKDNKSRNCPKPNPICGPCIPIQPLAQNPRSSLQDDSQKSPFILASAATRALADGDHLRGSLHTHSPPIVAVARSGPQICTEKCSFLL